MAHLPEIVVALDVGDRLTPQAKGLGRIYRRCWWCLAVSQPVQDVEDMGLGGNPCLQSQLDRAENRLLIMLQHQCQNLDHLPVPARALEQGPLELPEGIGHLYERRSIAQGTRLALDDREIMPPVIDGSSW